MIIDKLKERLLDCMTADGLVESDSEGFYIEHDEIVFERIGKNSFKILWKRKGKVIHAEAFDGLMKGSSIAITGMKFRSRVSFSFD